MSYRSAAYQVALFLQNKFSGDLTLGTNLFVGFDSPSAPNFVIMVIDSNRDPLYAGYHYSRPIVQILVRGERGSYTDAWAWIDDIVDVLHYRTRADGTTGGGNFSFLRVISGPTLVTLDEKKRPVISVNFTSLREDD